MRISPFVYDGPYTIYIPSKVTVSHSKYAPKVNLLVSELLFFA